MNLGSLAIVATLVVAGHGCNGRKASSEQAPIDELEKALRPAAAADTLKRLRGAHVKGTATFTVRPRVGTQVPHAGVPLSNETVTTTTELWIDERGQFRLVETNDQDGGREVVLHQGELAVALRYGKMIRRPAQEPEPTRILQEAVGAPWAAWETIRRYAEIETTADARYHLKKSAVPVPVEGTFAAPLPLRQWRDTVEVQSLEGEARLDAKSGALLAFALKARFTATRDQLPLEGELAVSTHLDGVGSTPLVSAPAAEPLSLRQRTVLDERALLGGLTQKETR